MLPLFIYSFNQILTKKDLLFLYLQSKNHIRINLYYGTSKFNSCAPSLIYPGKNQIRLLKKRNRLLKKLFENNIIKKTTYQLAILEEIPQKPYILPQIAPHLLQKIDKTQKGEFVKTSLDFNLQQQVNTIVSTHYNELQQNQIYNIAVLVLDVKTRKVLAYVGYTS